MEDKALYLEDEPASEEEDTQITRLITFRLGEEHYALDIKCVREVVKVPKLTRVPGTCSFVMGVTNLRGEILSLIDFAMLMGSQGSALEEDARIIVLDDISRNSTVGILVDSVSEIVDLKELEMEPPPATLAASQAQFVAGVIRIKGKIVGIIDPGSLSSVEPVST